MVHPLIRNAYGLLPSRMQETIKASFKGKVECARATRALQNVVRKTAILANVEAAVSSPHIHPDDEALTARLIKAYRLADGEGRQAGQSMWNVFFQNLHGDIHRTFMEGDLASCAKVLQNPRRTNLFHGFDALSGDLLPFAGSRRWRMANAMAAADGLVRLAEVLGARRYPFTEGLSTGFEKRAVIDPEQSLTEIDAILGTKTLFPSPYPDEHGLATSRGIVSYRVPQALYQAARIRELTQGISNPSILEIGGGLGRTAYYARQLGLTDYTIIDLPLTSLAQGSFLGRVLGGVSITLLGEERKGEQSQSIKLLSPRHFLKDERRYDLIINADSLTEMSQETAEAYMDAIMKRADCFLSINHESNAFTVRDLLKARAPKHPITRTPHAMRDGYVEETVRLK